jgi:hypothetical protein
MTGVVDVPSMAALGLGPIMLVAARIMWHSLRLRQKREM